MEKITIPDFGVIHSDCLSRILNRLSLLQQIRRDLHSRYVCILQVLEEPGPFIEADSVYHKIFTNAVRAEFKKAEEQINHEIYSILTAFTNAERSELTDFKSCPPNMEYLQEEVSKFKNLEENYLSARDALCGGDKPLAYPQVRWLLDSFDKDFEREKLFFADRISCLIQNK